jgi:gamma-glutamyltranspeptidase/glutathione hydrolase
MVKKRLLSFSSILVVSLMLLSLNPVPSQADTFRPVVRGKRGVVAGGQPLSVEAGLRMLQKGGNAVDAGVATILAASVIEFSHFSFGGEVPILIKLKGAEVVVVEGMGQAPLKATREFFVNRAQSSKLESAATAPDSSRAQSGAADMASIAGAKPGPIPSTGPLPATVPAVLDACVTALDNFGTKTLGEVMQPAIELADGFPIDELRVEYIKTRAPIFSQWPDAKRVFLPGGEVPKVGDIFVQADLAHTLREIVNAEKRARGNRHTGLMAARDYFYRGPVAKRIGDYMQSHGGLIAAEDFARFHAKTGQPVHTDYRGYQVYKAGFWTQGPALIETLNMLEGFDLKALGHNSASYIHTLAEALKLAMADRDRYYGDPNFTKIPMDELLSKSYATLRRPLIDPNKASLAQRPGDPMNMKPLLGGSFTTVGRISTVPPLERANDTTCVNVVDKDGNLFSATPSGAWLPAVVAGDTGVLMGQRLQSAVIDPNSPNVVAPGKRPRITLSPTLVLKGDEPFMVLSTPGGDNQDQALLQVLLNIIEFGMNPQEAVEAPRFDTQHFISSFDDHEFLPGSLNVESRVGLRIAQELGARGHKVKIQSEWGTLSSPTVILYDSRTGVAAAGADPRRGRYAVAW